MTAEQRSERAQRAIDGALGVALAIALPALLAWLLR